MRDEGHFHIAVDQFPVGFIGDQVDGVAVFAGLPGQKICQGLEGLPGVHHPGGVVGRVENQGLSVGTEHLLHRLQVDLKVRHIRGHRPERQPRLLYKGLILGEIGGNGQDLPFRHRQRPEHGHQLRRCAAAQEEVLRPGLGLVTPVQVVGNDLPGRIISGGGGVAVNRQRVGIPENVHNGLVHLRRGGNGRVAQGIIIHVFRADNGGPLPSVFKQIPDAGAVGAQGISGFVEHDRFLLQVSYSGAAGL